MRKIFLLLMLAGAVQAQVNFEHGDWQLICDNTHTCRAAGYQVDDGPVSVLLTREAGTNAAVRGELAWQAADDQSPPPAELTFTLKVGVGAANQPPDDKTPHPFTYI